MAIRIARATITIDAIAKELFPQPGEKASGYLDILERLQRNLQDNDDDPRYGRVIFGVEGQDKYVDISEGDIYLEGVFPRITSVRYKYGPNDDGFKRALSSNVVDTLLVVDNDVIAQRLAHSIRNSGYEVRTI